LRLSAILGVVLALLLAGELAWLNQIENSQAARQVEQSTEQSALALEASLKSIMLSGEGPIAHDWLKRVRQTTNFDDVRIYRRDGTEAFVDNATIDRVNDWLGRKRFKHHDRDFKPEAIPPSSLSLFAKAAAGTEVRNIDKGHLTLLLPIRIENACLQCHGYDGSPVNPVRGVLKLSVPTGALTNALDNQRREVLGSAAIVILMMALALMWLLKREVIRPISLLEAGAKRIEEGDESYRVTLDRPDELGSLAEMFNELVSHLQRQTHRQKSISEAIVSLSRELVDDVVLRRIGELAMQLTGARYAMLSYQEDGEKQFIPMGMDNLELEKLKIHPPQGLGLLGLMWQDRQVVRIDHIGNHPKSIGFPEGHPPMTTFLGVPIEFAGEMIGALYLTDKADGQPFSEDDESIIRMLASSCAVALSNAKQFEGLQEANAELENRVAERTSELSNANRLLRSHEIELELMNDELRHASEAKNQFLANTSHELRTPLNAIIGFSDLLLVQAKELPAKYKEYIEHINVSGRRLLDLINSLLDLSKIEAGMLEIHHEPTIPGTVLKFTINHLRPLLDKKRLEVSVVIPEEDRTAYLDAGKLQQVWVNLIGNAIKFTPEGGRIEVGFAVSGSDSNAMFEGWVRDSGIGIEAGDIERIFQPFVQAEGGLTREFGGTGLGLTLVRRLLEMQGGSIRVESTPGAGSMFAFTLPVRLASIEGEVIPVSIDEHQQGMMEHQSSMEVVEEQIPELVELPVILIVDNDRARAASVISLLKVEGYQGEMCDLAEVEQYAEEKCPFLIMVGIPEDPVDIYRQLHLLRSRKATRQIPIVLLGGDAESPSFSLGTVDTMDKQVSKNELVNLITRHGRQSSHAPGMTVLIIDDEASVREYIKECLRGQGYRLLLAANGHDGIQAAIEHDPDLIILDLMMPGISGFEVVEELKRHPTACDIPVVIFSAKDLTREEVMRLGQEVEKVLTKGNTSRTDLLRELRSMELLYPVQARLMDSVLRCYNLRYKHLRLAQECNRAERYGQTFSLVGWRMDGYDDYVEKYGQRWGVAALKDVVELVNVVTREGDVLIRISEASFMLILTGTTQSIAERVAEKLRLRIRIHKFPLPGGEIGHFTASFGCAQFGIGAFNPDELVAQLKNRMAAAANSGGDRCVCFDGAES
jgi:diguanylate cyclase (GGDEF)-like protein